jgi:hypothetical protein
MLILMSWLFFLTAGNSQCIINELEISPGSCGVNGDFFVTVNFNHAGTSPIFKVQGNGVNYGSFRYDSLPVLIGPLKADCKTNYEFVIRDLENNACTAFKNIGKKCCDNNCKISFENVKAGACNDNNYSLGFNLKYTSSGSGFDVFNNGKFFGFYKYSDLPLNLSKLPSSTIEPNNTIVVCASDNLSCCDTLVLPNPCICNIYKIKTQIIDCKEADSTFSLKIDFKHNLTSDSFQVGGNTKNYGKYAYKDLPVTIKGLKFSSTTDYEFLIVDKNDAFCFGSYPLGFVTNCNFPCEISDVKAEVLECNQEGNFYVNLTFKEKNTSIAGFLIRGNGKIYGEYKYGEPSYKVGPLKGDCQTQYEFVVVDKELKDCSSFTFLKDSICCEAKCSLANISIKENCENEILKSFEINFDHQNVSGSFILQINDKVIGTYKYADLPLKISNFNFDLPNIKIKIIDLEKNNCFLIKEFKFKCFPASSCKIYDLVVTVGECNDKGEFYAKIKFKHLNTGNSNFGVKVNGVLVDTLPYGLDVYEIGPLKGDCNTLYKFLVYDFQFPNCADDYAFTEKVCCGKEDCNINDLIIKASECNDKGEFYAILKFNIQNPGNRGFVVKVNGVFFDSLNYGKPAYEIGPLKGDCSTLYKFIIFDREFEACREDFSFTEKICCNKEECKIKDPLLTFSECNDDKYNIILNFAHAGSTSDFRVKINGIFKGVFKYKDLPVTLTGFQEKTAHEITIWDSANEACRLIFNIPGIECTSGTDDLLSAMVVMSVNQELLTINSTAAGTMEQLAVYDMQGRLWHIHKSIQNEAQLDISNLPSGMYLVSMSINQRRINKKFIKP